jgi:hypothetical protein
MGATVNGLVVHANNKVSGRLIRNRTAAIIASIECPGIGRKAINKPVAIPPDADRRVRWNIFGSCKIPLKMPILCIDFIAS